MAVRLVSGIRLYNRLHEFCDRRYFHAVWGLRVYEVVGALYSLRVLLLCTSWLHCVPTTCTR